ncbi:MAG: hypothetical protein AAF724_06275 [Pseudomonadota bacterium]
MRHSFISVAAYVSCLVILTSGQAYASGKYDKRIEQAAKDITAQKMGEIRGSHGIHQPFYLHPPIEARSAEQGTLKPARRGENPTFTIHFQGNN